MLAAGEALDLAQVLLDLLIIIVVAKVAADLAERVKVPAVLGEILAGILIGPSVLGLIDPGNADTGSMLLLIGEIGVLLLLLQVGLEMDLGELGKVGKASLLVAVIGVGGPFIFGALGAWGMGENGKTAIFLGAALTATSVGITARVLGDLKALSRTESRIVLGAAVADDVLGLVILTVVVKVVTEGSVGVGTVASTIGQALAFLVVTGLLGIFAVPWLFDRISKYAKAGAVLLAAAFALMLAFAELADAAKLAFIIGAFMAGLAIGRTRQHHQIARDLAPIGNLFIPVFFVGIGVNADLEAMAKPEVLGLAAVLTTIGILGKLAAGWGAVGTKADKVMIGIGMIPRGEVGLIFASIGLSRGVLDDDLYGALLIMVLVTTLIAPPMLRWRIQRNDAAAATPTDEPEGGWLHVVDGRITLHGTPPVEATVPLALIAARHAADGARPDDSLLTWFAANSDAELTWTDDDLDELLPLLAAGDPRSWRLLEVTGVLERALPEVHHSVERHRHDPGELDLLRSLRFPTVERVQAAINEEAGPLRTYDAVHDPDGNSAAVLLVAAMAHDVSDGDPNATPDELITRLRLDPPELAEDAKATVTVARALHGASGGVTRTDASTIDRLHEAAGTVRVAGLAGALAVAMHNGSDVQRSTLDALVAGVIDSFGGN
jgi:Kef-type K+ transport system membrane component KefB